MERKGKARHDQAISFRHITLSLDNDERLNTYFSQLEPNVTLAEGQVVEPLRYNFLQTIRADDQETTTVGARIVCDIDGPTLFDSDWQDDLFDDLHGYYASIGSHQTFSLPHEPDALYVKPRLHGETLRIKAFSETDSCGVYITPVSNQYILHAQGSSVSEEDSVIPPLDKVLVHEVAHAWAKTQDILFSRYLPQWSDDSYKEMHISVPDTWQEPCDTFDETTVEAEEVAMFDAQEIVDYISTAEIAFDKIGGHFAAKERLKEIGMAFTDPDGAAMFGVNAPSFILQGESGTGKTSLVEAFAEATNAELVTISMVDIQDKYIGETAKSIHQKFEEAKESDGKIILFFDEIDTLISEDNHQEFLNATKSLGQSIEEIAKYYPNILVAGCMNSDQSDVVDSIVRSGRLEIISIMAPTTYEELRDVWYSVLYNQRSPLENITTLSELEALTSSSYDTSLDILQLAEVSVGLTGADITKVLADVRMQKFYQRKKLGHTTPITQNDILQKITAYNARRNELD